MAKRSNTLVVSVKNLGSEEEPSMAVFVRTHAKSDYLLNEKVKLDTAEHYIIRGMVGTGVEYELDELVQAAFELGRRFEKKYGKPGIRIPV